MKIKKRMLKWFIIFIVFIALLFQIIFMNYHILKSQRNSNNNQKANLSEEVNNQFNELENNDLKFSETETNNNTSEENNNHNIVDDNNFSTQDNKEIIKKEEVKQNQNKTENNIEKKEEVKENQNNSKEEEKNNETNTEVLDDETSSQNNLTIEKTEELQELKPWEKIGVSEYDYYHSPMWKWEKVDFVFNGSGENGCVSMEDCNAKCDAYGAVYGLTHNGTFYCSEVYSYSGNYLGEYFIFIES